MITVYHLENSRSERVIWLMEELGLPYAVERFQREPDMTAPPVLKEIDPMGKAPMIRDVDSVLIESGAIIEYIIHRHGGGKFAVPAASVDYPRYLQWMHAAEGTVMTQFILNLYITRFFPSTAAPSPLVDRVKVESQRLIRRFDDELATQPYFAGQEFTAADIMMMYCLGFVRGFMRAEMSLYPNIQAYFSRIEQRPGYQRGMAIANPASA